SAARLAARAVPLLALIVAVAVGLPATALATPAGYLYSVARAGAAGFSGGGGSSIDARVNARCVGGLAGRDMLIAGGARVRRIDHRGRIETVAGTGTPGFSGDGGPARSAQLAQLALGRTCALAADGEGGYLLTDGANNRIRRVAADGVISTIA